MKKWFLGILLLLFVIIITLYALIPAKVVVSKAIAVSCAPDAAFRFISDPARVKRWWPSMDFFADTSFIYKEDTFTVRDGFDHLVNIDIRGNGFALKSIVNILSLPSDTVVINWQCALNAGLNPFNRLKQYKQVVHIGTAMTEILQSYANYVNHKDNIYRYSMAVVSTMDTVLVATRFMDSVYPGTPQVYQKIDLLRKYALSHGAIVTGSPMLNVTRLDAKQLQIMIALPVNKDLPENNEFFRRRMVPGHFLATEVTGGEGSVADAMQEVANYFADYKKTSMAIPFQYLITDRRVEKDTSAWKTRIYAPIF